MNTLHSPRIELSKAIDVLLRDHPSALVAVAGMTGAGKTCLARNLARRFQLSILQTDTFLRQVGNETTYDVTCIRKRLEKNREIGQPTIIEGCIVLVMLDEIGIKQDYLVYVERPRHADVDPSSTDPYYHESTVRQPVDIGIFGSTHCHADAKKRADFILPYDGEMNGPCTERSPW